MSVEGPAPKRATAIQPNPAAIKSLIVPALSEVDNHKMTCQSNQHRRCGYLDSSRSGQALPQPGFDIRDDSMRQPHEFAIHMGAGLNNGLTLKRNRGSSHPGAAIRWLPCHRNSTGCCRRGYQKAWSRRRRKLHWPPRPALTLNGTRTAGVERRGYRLVNHDKYRDVGLWGFEMAFYRTDNAVRGERHRISAVAMVAGGGRI